MKRCGKFVNMLSTKGTRLIAMTIIPKTTLASIAVVCFWRVLGVMTALAWLTVLLKRRITIP